MNQSREAKNKALVLEAFEILFNKRDYTAAEGVLVARLCSTQRAHRPGRDGLFDLIKSLPATLKYQAGMNRSRGGYRHRPRAISSGFGAPSTGSRRTSSASMTRHGRALGRHPRRASREQSRAACRCSGRISRVRPPVV